MGQAAVNATSERILLSSRAKVLRELVKREAKLERLYGRKIQKLEKELRTGTGVTAKINRAFDDLTVELRPDIERMIQTGSITGKQAARKTFKKLFGRRASAVFPTDRESLIEAGRRIRGRNTVDGVSLSRRVWRAHRQTGSQMATAIQNSIRAGNSMSQTAEELLRVRRPRLTPPEYASRLADEARRGGDVLQKVSRKAEAQLNRLGSAAGDEFSMRPAARQLQKALKTAKPEQIQKHLDQFMRDKAQQHTRMIARSETIESYRDSYRESTKDHDWVKGYTWELSGSHPRPDECDILAGQDLYGLGSGGYPEDAVPDTPHPNDMCIQVAIIDTDHFKREKAKRNDEPLPPEPWKSGKKETSEQWLKKQSATKQKAILGPTKYDHFKRAPTQVLGKNGIPKRVKDLRAAPTAAARPTPRIPTPRVLAAPKPKTWPTSLPADVTAAPKVSKPAKVRVSAKQPHIPAGLQPLIKRSPPGKSPQWRAGYTEVMKAKKIPKESWIGHNDTLETAMKKIANSRFEQSVVWEPNGKLYGAFTQAKTSAVKDGFSRIGAKGKAFRAKNFRTHGHYGTHLHNHPSASAGFSDKDIISYANDKLLGQAYTITSRGQAMHFQVTDATKWQKAWKGINVGGQTTPFVNRVRGASNAAAKLATEKQISATAKSASKVWEKAYAAEVEKKLNIVGRQYGFEVKTIDVW